MSINTRTRKPDLVWSQRASASHSTKYALLGGITIQITALLIELCLRSHNRATEGERQWARATLCWFSSPPVKDIYIDLKFRIMFLVPHIGIRQTERRRSVFFKMADLKWSAWIQIKGSNIIKVTCVTMVTRRRLKMLKWSRGRHGSWIYGHDMDSQCCSYNPAWLHV